MREILVEKLVGMLVLLTCMLWAAAEKPYHDRVGGEKPDCTGTMKHVVCRPKDNTDRECFFLDIEYLEDKENRIAIPSSAKTCTGDRYEGCQPKEGSRPSYECKQIIK